MKQHAAAGNRPLQRLIVIPTNIVPGKLDTGCAVGLNRPGFPGGSDS